jgi:enoyl-CoA hydratase/carnithine racemase
MQPQIELEIAAPIGWIRFNRPQVSNAVRPRTMQELCAAIDSCIAAEEVRAVVLTGNGRHFSAGGDLKWLHELSEQSTATTRDTLYEWFIGAARRLWRCPKPTVAAVNGHAVTVGCELALACDIRVGCPSTVFHESWLRLGLLAPLGGAVLLPRIVGLARAKEMLLGGRAVGGHEALAIGLVSELVAAEELRQRATERAHELASLPARSYRLAKESLQRPIEGDMEREWQTNALSQAMLLGSEDFRQALTRLEKR